MTEARREPLEIRLSGIGGQGLVLAGEILAQAFTLAGMQVALSLAYEPTSRGGLSRSDLVASREPVDYPLVTALHQLLVLDQFAANASVHLARPGCLVLTDAERVSEPPEGDLAIVPLPLADTARSLGNPRVANIVALGALAAVGGGVGLGSLEAAVRARTPPRFLELNLAALARGSELGAQARAQSV